MLKHPGYEFADGRGIDTFLVESDVERCLEGSLNCNQQPTTGLGIGKNDPIGFIGRAKAREP